MNIFTQKELFEGELSLNQDATLRVQEYQPTDKSQHHDTQISGLKKEVIVNKGDDVISPDEQTILKIKRMDSYVLLFSEFLEKEFSLSYDELSPTIDYVSTFVGGVKFNYKLPQAFKYTKEEIVKRRLHLCNPSEVASLLVHNKGTGSLVGWLKANVLSQQTQITKTA